MDTSFYKNITQESEDRFNNVTDSNDQAPHSDVQTEHTDSNDLPNEEVYAAQKINVPSVDRGAPENERKGLKVFCLILVITVLLSCCSVGGYFLGKRTFEGQKLQNKPDGVSAGNAADVYVSVSSGIVGLYIYNEQGKVYNASGIVYTEDGYIITTDSIYENIPNSKFKVFTSDGKQYDAVFVAGDSRSDISVIKINENVKLSPAVMGNSDQVITGETVYSVGFSNGYNESAVLSDGIVSAANTRVTNSVTNYSTKMIQTTVGANPGSFGGALVNQYGQIIGMLSTKIVSTGYEESAYAVPSVTIKTIADSLIKDKKVPDRARIGISYYFANSADAEIKGLSAAGLCVASVDKGSELYGILKEKDVITHINGTEIVRDDIVLDVLESLKPGDVVKLTVVSENGAKSDYNVKLLTYESSSSYNSLSGSQNSSSNDGTFDFPEGY